MNTYDDMVNIVEGITFNSKHQGNDDSFMRRKEFEREENERFIESTIKGLIGYYKHIQQQFEQHPNNLTPYEDLDELKKYLQTKELNSLIGWAHNA